MRDIRDVKLAELMVGHSASVKKGDKVLIYGDTAAEPLIREIYLKSLEVGAFPVVVPMFRELNRLQLMHGSDEQIASFPDFMITIAETYDVIFFVYAEENTQALNQVPPEKVSAYFKGRQKFSQIMLGRAARGETTLVAGALSDPGLRPGRRDEPDGIRGFPVPGLHARSGRPYWLLAGCFSPTG